MSTEEPKKEESPQVATPSSVTEEEPKTESRSALTYIFIAVLAVALVMLIYYAYNRFVTNKIKEPMTKGLEQERDDPIADFNLREAIRELQNIQRNVLGTLSEASSI